MYGYSKKKCLKEILFSLPVKQSFEYDITINWTVPKIVVPEHELTESQASLLVSAFKISLDAAETTKEYSRILVVLKQIHVTQTHVVQFLCVNNNNK